MIRCVTYNTQTHYGEKSKLKAQDLLDIDLVFLQRCRQQLVTELNTSHDFYVYWEEATLEDNNAGMCVMSKTPLSVITTTVDININHSDRSQSCKYQIFEYAGLNFLNYLPPYPPEESGANIFTEMGYQQKYIKSFMAEDFDVAAGDCHTHYYDDNSRNRITQFFTEQHTVANKQPNFIDKQDRGIILNWIIINQDKLELIDEHVILPSGKQSHCPIKFNLTLK